MDESLLVWISAIESGFAQPAEWVGWADRQILRLDNPPVWILDLSLQHSAKEALQILWAASCQVAPELWETIDTTGLYFGFLYLGFERNELSMLDLLTQAGKKADGASFRIECEAFYLLANEIDGGGPTKLSDTPLSQRVAELFLPLADYARRLWNELMYPAVQ